MEMSVVVLTSDKYVNALRPFAYLFNRYWGPDQRVVIAGYSPLPFELPPNFTYYSIGPQSAYPVEKWSDGLIDFLEAHPDMEFPILFLEDYWIVRDVNRQAVKMLRDYMAQFRNVLKIDLGTDRLYAAGMTDYGSCGYIDLILSDYRSQYQLSLMCGLWNRDLLLRFLVRGESPWAVELSGTPRVAAAGNDVLVLGSRQFPVRHILAHRRGNPDELLLEGLRDVDVQELRNLGYL